MPPGNGGGGESGFGIVVPSGDPGALDHAAATCRSIAGTMSRVSDDLSAASVVDGWSGVAQQNYGGGVRADARAPSAAQEAFLLAGRVFHELAHELRVAQRATRKALAAAEAADAAARAAAGARADAARDSTAALNRATAANQTIQQAALRGDPAPAAQADHADALLAAQRADTAAEAAGRAHDRATSDLQSAQEAGHAAYERYQREALRAAQVLSGLAQVPAIMAGAAGTPFGATGGPGAPAGVLPLFLRGAPPAGGKQDDDSLGRDLINTLGFLWSGNGDKHFQIRKVATTLATMYGSVKWTRALGEYGSWLRAGVQTTSAGQMTLADYSAFLANKAAPTLNNGLAGRGLVWAGSKVPALEPAAAWLGDASKATPFFTKAAPFLAAPGVVFAGYQLYKDGNPVEAAKKDPAKYATHVTSMAFSASTLAFVVAPNPITGGAVIVTGVAFAGAEVWEHHQEIWDFTKDTADVVWDTSAPGIVWNHREEIGNALDTGYHATVDTGEKLVGGAAHGVSSQAKSVWHALGG